MANLLRQLNNYRLTTAHILYHYPDHPHLLQSYIWQEYDLAPHFPELKRFLDFWQRELEGKLHSVKVAAAESLHSSDYRYSNHYVSLH